jgi:hypothetical protein
MVGGVIIGTPACAYSFRFLACARKSARPSKSTVQICTNKYCTAHIYVLRLKVFLCWSTSKNIKKSKKEEVVFIEVYNRTLSVLKMCTVDKKIVEN